MTYEVVSLDTNVVIAALNRNDVHHEAALGFFEVRGSDPLVLPAAVYAELLALPGAGAVRQFIEQYRLRPLFSSLDTPRVWELAAERFARYVRSRRRSGGGRPGRILADFLIGAQALAQVEQGYTPAFATLDARFFGRYFPELKVLDLV